MRYFWGCVLSFCFIVLPLTAATNDNSPAEYTAKGAPGSDTSAEAKTEAITQPPDSSLEMEIDELREEIYRQTQQLDQQREQLLLQQHQMEAIEERLKIGITPSNTAAVASIDPTPQPARSAATAPPQAVTPVQSAVSIGDLGKKLDGVAGNLGDFKFSGDFRFRLDSQLRTGNAIAGPLQNVRSRYRLRFNVDKELDSHFRFHFQLSTGPLSNAITNDQDMGSTVAKHPFSISEAYVDFHPSKRLSMRGGRMEEVFADNMRFLWDDDVRFNGFQQVISIPFASKPAGITSIEFRGGEYFLSNPNVVILAAGSPFLNAGYSVGQKVRDSNLFHPGIVLRQDLGSLWAQQFTTDLQWYRNQNQIQLASLATGVPVVVQNGLGITLSGPLTGTGNATTTSGGAIYSARNFQIARIAYRLERKDVKVGNREMPVWFDFQTARNAGTSRERDAGMASVNFGGVRNRGDVRLMYQFAVKDANAMISQFTDDDLGTGTGVNIAVHAMRFDVGLTRFLQWQNIFFIQHEKSASNPAELFFVPVAQGANATFRYLGQLAFTF